MNERFDEPIKNYQYHSAENALRGPLNIEKRFSRTENIKKNSSFRVKSADKPNHLSLVDSTTTICFTIIICFVAALIMACVTD